MTYWHCIKEGGRCDSSSQRELVIFYPKSEYPRISWIIPLAFIIPVRTEDKMITLSADYIHGRTPPFSYSHGTLPCDCVHFKGAISSKKPEGRSPTGNLIPYSFTDVRTGVNQKRCCHECNSVCKDKQFIKQCQGFSSDIKN